MTMTPPTHHRPVPGAAGSRTHARLHRRAPSRDNGRRSGLCPLRAPAAHDARAVAR